MLVLVGEINAVDLAPGLVVVRLSRDDGAGFDVPADVEEHDGASRLTTRVRLATCADGGPLPEGTWTAEWRLVAPGVERPKPAPCEDGLDTVRWWRGMRPMHARVPADQETLTLRIAPVDMGRALCRRLGMS